MGMKYARPLDFGCFWNPLRFENFLDQDWVMESNSINMPPRIPIVYVNSHMKNIGGMVKRQR